FQARPSDETRALFHALGANREPLPAAAEPGRRRALAASSPPGGGDMVPLIVVAPLQTAAGDEPLASLAEFCADDIRVSLSRRRGIQVLGLDRTALPDMLRH